MYFCMRQFACVYSFFFFLKYIKVPGHFTYVVCMSYIVYRKLFMIVSVTLSRPYYPG